MTVLRVFLVVCALVMVGASADASASSTATGTWTLTVTFAGTGTGVITSSPAGIVCTNVDGSPEGTCSAQFPDDISPWVIATPIGPIVGSTGSTYTTISGACGPDTHAGVLFNLCQAGPGNGPAEVTFTVRPVPCKVTRVIGYTLASAKRHLGPYCKVGTVRYAYDSGAKKGLVISQNPKPFWRRQQGAVNLVVSKGEGGS